MAAVIAVDVWKTTPFMALLILAGLQMLPQDCYDNAKIDGVHPLTVFFRVTLPLLEPALLVAIILRTLHFRDLRCRATTTMAIYARQHLVDFQDVGYGSAAATLVFMIIAVFTVVYLYLGGLGREEQA